MITVNPPETLTYQNTRYKCALGRSGVTNDKKEGDGKTPAGIFPIRKILYRFDRLIRPKTKLNIAPLKPTDAWSDDPEHIDYNKQVSLPHDGHVEKLWRKDNLYNIIVIIGYNDEKPVKVQGSAIFIHVAQADFQKTRGCIALKQFDLLKIITNPIGPSHIEILF